MEYDELTQKLYQENINWVYSIIRELDKAGVERKSKFIADPYLFNNIIALGYYFMNLYVVSNIKEYGNDNSTIIMNSIINGASSYDQHRLEQIYKRSIELDKLVEQYNSIVRVTKTYAPDDGLKARIVAVDDVYRRIYSVFNKRHFNVFIKVFMESFTEYEKCIKATIDDYFKQGE